MCNDGLFILQVVVLFGHLMKKIRFKSEEKISELIFTPSFSLRIPLLRIFTHRLNQVFRFFKYDKSFETVRVPRFYEITSFHYIDIFLKVKIVRIYN